jgi:hypothetical protein
MDKVLTALMRGLAERLCRRLRPISAKWASPFPHPGRISTAAGVLSPHVKTAQPYARGHYPKEIVPGWSVLGGLVEDACG